MTTFEWFLLIVVVIGVPLVVAVVVTLWTLEQARQRNRKNRPGADAGGPVKRNATRLAEDPASPDVLGERAAPEATSRAAEAQPEQLREQLPVRESGSTG